MGRDTDSNQLKARDEALETFERIERMEQTKKRPIILQ